MAVRASGRFNIQGAQGLIPGVSYRCCTLKQRADGYGDAFTTIAWEKGEVGRGQAEPAVLSLPGLKAEVSHKTG